MTSAADRIDPSSMDSDHLEVFWGRSTPNQARIYARLTGDRIAPGVRLRGRISGPESPYASTLAASFDFVDMGPGPVPLAEAVVVDPCYWTPGMPYVYRVEIEAIHDNQVLMTVERLLGIRPLGTRGRSFFLAGKRWVARGVSRPQLALEEADEWAATAAVAVVPPPSDQALREASLRGLPLAVRLTGPPDPMNRELRRLARWPAAMLAVIELPSDVLNDPASRSMNDAAGNQAPKLSFSTGATTSAPETSPGESSGSRLVAPSTLLVGHFRGAGSQSPPWSQFLVLVANNVEAFRNRAAEGEGPVVAWHPAPPDLLIADARKLCDRLQRDLAPVGDFAGYFV